MKNNQLFITSLLVVSLTLFSSCKKESDSSNTFSGIKDSMKVETSNMGFENVSKDKAITFDFSPTSTTGQIIKHEYYSLSYSEKAEQAEWVAYELKKSYLKRNNFQRPYFNEDLKVKTGSADWRNYRKSGYDKGHLCPAGDMGFDISAYNDTFLTSNISPQNHDFNAGVWNRLEQKVRYWAAMYDGVYIVTGGVLSDKMGTIGDEAVIVPKYFYKILLDNSNGEYKMIAFLVPNKSSDKPLYDFVVSVDSVEKMTGIDFFPKLEDKIENSLEKRNDYKAWLFN